MFYFVVCSVLDFNRFDLYTKDGAGLKGVDPEQLWPYYDSLIEKYGLSGPLMW